MDAEASLPGSLAVAAAATVPVAKTHTPAVIETNNTPRRHCLILIEPSGISIRLIDKPPS